MNRRSFLRSLGGAVAAAMLPFQKLPQLTAPKKAKEFSSAISPFWLQTTRASRCVDQGYLDAMKAIMAKVELSGKYSGEFITTEQQEMQHKFARSFFFK